MTQIQNRRSFLRGLLKGVGFMAATLSISYEAACWVVSHARSPKIEGQQRLTPLPSRPFDESVLRHPHDLAG